jgi:hypothetical protein
MSHRRRNIFGGTMFKLFAIFLRKIAEKSLTAGTDVIASKAMKLNFLRAMAAAIALMFVSGCYTAGDRRHIDLVPIGMGTDRVESRYERPVEQIFAAAKEVLRFNGTLYGENTISHNLEAKVDTRTVWVTVDEVEPKISRVVVVARKKSTLPDIALAAEIDKQIALRLK